jgi:hypothetical protein
VVQAPAFETKVSPAGVTSATETPAASLGPLLVTVTVYTRSVPGTTLAGPPCVIATSADTATVVVAVALLLPATGSNVVLEAEAVFEMTVPFAVPAPTLTTSVTLRALGAPVAVAPAQEQSTNPVPPTAGVVQLPPALGVAERKVVLAGVLSWIVRTCAGSGPLFVATSV